MCRPSERPAGIPPPGRACLVEASLVSQVSVCRTRQTGMTDRSRPGPMDTHSCSTPSPLHVRPKSTTELPPCTCGLCPCPLGTRAELLAWQAEEPVFPCPPPVSHRSCHGSCRAISDRGHDQRLVGG
ncbi:hypothetical protein Bbelb_327480 [Branchiostoma belcheri]|nr:hypothetical protein Bbelb_327480 [Branchiostoma belcheri]